MSSSHTANMFSPGQRWVSQAEPELGMGILMGADKRTVELDFPAGQCRRMYARAGAPIKRVGFKPGDRITDTAGLTIVVEAVQEADGCFVYVCGEVQIHERDLSPETGFSLPLERLMAGMAGTPSEFRLRQDILARRAAYERSPARGFLGGQVDLIPHQFYIAGEMVGRHTPRVLLSDETGLGKTIEACLILHQMLVSHRIRRVLVIVPDALVHQWFVELYRKFNLSFRLFNAEHCLAAGKSEPGVNLFLEDQQGICSQAFIRKHRRIREQIIDAGWDMVIMDEAHHILDDREFFTFMEALGTRTRGLMLLSATPEQMGTRTYFSLLKLLDPQRYFDFKTYTEEAETYRRTAQQALEMIRRGDDPRALVDAHGPGRVIFRNTRAAIKGFPDRKAVMTPLSGQGLAQPVADEFARPDRIADDQFLSDPRIDCLADLARQVKPEKILVICSSKAKTVAVEKALQTRISVDAARFDETMSLMQRDRAAAWFSREDGARLLICSEIGSEGRNFQFVRHLFLFDLPVSPELLEQRIGRVDRIGRHRDIFIHVPYIKDTPFHVLACWYMQGMNLFEKNMNGVHAVYKAFEKPLERMLDKTASQGKVPEAELEAIIRETKAFRREKQAELAGGKDILLERNSNRPEKAKQLIAHINVMDEDQGLPDLLERLLDYYGIDMDPGGSHIFRLDRERPTDDGFPALPRNARHITFHRPTAIAREDLPFFSWDHPFVNQALDYFTTRETGSCAVGQLESPEAPAGIFLEAVFILECPPEPGLNMERFLPPTPLRVIVDHTGASCSDADWAKKPVLQPDRPAWFLEHEAIAEELLPQMMETAQIHAKKKAKEAIRNTGQRIDKTLEPEIDRLKALQSVNPHINDVEINGMIQEKETLESLLSRADVRLDSLCLIRNTPG